MNKDLVTYRDKTAQLGYLQWWFLSPMAISSIAKDLSEKDYVVVDDFCSKEHCSELRRFIVERRKEGKMLSGTEWLRQVRSKGKHVTKEYVDDLRKRVRSDLVFWCNGDKSGEESVSQYSERLSTLLDKLKNEVIELKQVQSRSEAMLTCYPPGGTRYSVHVDNPDPSKSERKLTAILYLNPSWKNSHGGELEIYDPSTQKTPRARIEPHEARLLLFWSDKRVPHAVLPSYANRYAVTIWLYATPPKESKTKKKKRKSSIKERMIRAKEEVAKLRDEVGRLTTSTTTTSTKKNNVSNSVKSSKDKIKLTHKKKTTLTKSAQNAIRELAKAYQNETLSKDREEALLQLAYDLPDNIAEIPVSEAMRVLLPSDLSTKLQEENIKTFNWGDSSKFVKIYIPMSFDEKQDRVQVQLLEKRKISVTFNLIRTHTKKVLNLASLPGDVKKVTWKRKHSEEKGDEVVVVIWKQKRDVKWDLSSILSSQ